MFPLQKKNISILFFQIILAINLFYLFRTDRIEARIKLDGKNSWKIVYSNSNETEIYVAKAYYTDSFLEIGWDKLAITTNSMFKDEIQTEGTGRLEGELTRDRIYWHYQNIKDDYPVDDKISDFFQKQESFIFDSIKKDGKNDPIIYNSYLIKIQYNAIMNQYNSVVDSTRRLTKNDFHQINYVEEIPDLIEKFRVEKYGENNYSKIPEKDLSFNRYLFKKNTLLSII